MTLENLISVWGPPAVLAGTFLEGETAAILGGMLAHRQLASWPEIAAIAAAGAFAADQMWFLLSRHAPSGRLLRRIEGAPHAARFRALLDRRRIAATLAFRFIPGTRILGPALLARTSMGWPLFAALNAASVVLWAVIFTGIGYHFGRTAEGLLGHLEARRWLVLALVAGVFLLAGHFALHRLRR